MRSIFIGVFSVLLLLHSPHSASRAFTLTNHPAFDSSLAQNKTRPKKRKPVQTVRESDVPPWFRVAPNPLTLVVTVTESRQLLLNQEDVGTLGDLNRLRARLEGIFEQRKQSGAFRMGTVLVFKTVIIRASPYLKQDEISSLVGEVWAAGADPIHVVSEAEFKMQFQYPYDPAPQPQPLPAKEKERIRRMGPISGGVLNGKAISMPKPIYPSMIDKPRVSGTVVVEIMIDESGNVISARAVSGPALLRSSAVQAARLAKFSQTLLSGQPVKVTGVIYYKIAP